jgi:hypothetical protein
MRILVTILLSLLLLAPASAATIRPMTASPGVDELRRACSSAGGDFVIHADGGGYGCIVKNCDGKGGICQIACDNNNNCNGSTPLIIRNAVTLLGILQNGDMVVRDRTTTGGTNSLSDKGPSGAAAAAPPATKVEPSFY